jgi:hypothetical protein
MFICFDCCVLSGKGLYVELIAHSEESYRMWCVVLCILETSRLRRIWAALGRLRQNVGNETTTWAEIRQIKYLRDEVTNRHGTIGSGANLRITVQKHSVHVT